MINYDVRGGCPCDHPAHTWECRGPVLRCDYSSSVLLYDFGGQKYIKRTLPIWKEGRVHVRDLSLVPLREGRVVTCFCPTLVPQESGVVSKVSSIGGCLRCGR